MHKSICVLAAAASLVSPVFAQPAAGGDARRDPATGRRGDYRYLMMDSRGVITPYPLHEQILPRWFYREGYRLTPREYHRWRSAGFRPREVYMIANAARVTALDPSVFANAMYRGYDARKISLEYQVSREQLTRVLPEWRTAAWAAATREEPVRDETLNVWW